MVPVPYIVGFRDDVLVGYLQRMIVFQVRLTPTPVRCGYSGNKFLEFQEPMSCWLRNQMKPRSYAALMLKGTSGCMSGMPPSFREPLVLDSALHAQCHVSAAE